MKFKMNCVRCNKEINPLRVKALPNVKICIKCAEGIVQRKAGVSVTYGSGDHTWTETVIMDQSTYQKNHIKQTLKDDEHIVEFIVE